VKENLDPEGRLDNEQELIDLLDSLGFKSEDSTDTNILQITLKLMDKIYLLVNVNYFVLQEFACIQKN